MCHAFYRAPGGYPMQLDPVQQKVFNVLEFGDDISIFPPEVIRPHYYVLMNWPRQFGKTFTVKQCAATAAPIQTLQIGCYASHENRSRILLAKIKDALMNSDFSGQVNWKHKSKQHLDLVNGSMINAFNTSELQIRGDTEDLVLVDEADFILDNDLILDSIEPKTLIPRQYGLGKMLLISTPNMRNDGSVFKKWYFEALGSRKLFCQVCHKILPIADFLSSKVKETDFNVYNVPKVDNCACGATKFVYYYDSEKMIIPVDPKQNPRITWPDLKKRLDSRNWSPKARQEYLGEIVQSGSGMFPLETLVRIEDPRLRNFLHPPRDWDPSEHDTCAGLDYGKTHDNTVLSVFERKNHEFHLLSMHVLESEIDSPSWEDIRRFVRPIIAEWEPGLLAVDCTGLGSESAERMVRDIEDLDTVMVNNKRNHIGYYIDRKSKQELVNNMEEKVKSMQVKIPPVYEPGMPELRSEMLNFGYEVTKASNIIYHAMRGKDDRVISFAMGLIGFEQDVFPDMTDAVMVFTR